MDKISNILDSVSDTTFVTELVYAEKSPSKELSKSLVPSDYSLPDTLTSSPNLSEDESKSLKSSPVFKVRLRCWINEATLSFGYSTSTKQKRFPTPSQKQTWKPNPINITSNV